MDLRNHHRSSRNVSAGRSRAGRGDGSGGCWAIVNGGRGEAENEAAGEYHGGLPKVVVCDDVC